MDQRLLPTNRRFVVAIRIRTLGLALFLGLACGHRAEADPLSSSSGWAWFVGNASGSAPGGSSLNRAFLPAANAAAPPPAQAPPAVAEGFLNFGAGPYPAAGWIASGNPQPWSTSPQVAALFGGTPTAAQQAAFTVADPQLTEKTFQLSGIPVTLTTDPTVPAAHTLSVVSDSSSIPFPTAIGTTNLGGSGFSFIDQEAKVSSSVGQLELILAHNIAHELMLAFGVPETFDQTGNYIDATNANWSMITGPAATCSPAAAQAINRALQAPGPSAGDASLAQSIGPQAAPEPATI